MMTNPYVPRGTDSDTLDFYREIVKQKDRDIFALAPLVERLHDGDWSRYSLSLFFSEHQTKAQEFWRRPVISFQHFWKLLRRSRREWLEINRLSKSFLDENPEWNEAKTA